MVVRGGDRGETHGATGWDTSQSAMVRGVTSADRRGLCGEIFYGACAPDTMEIRAVWIGTAAMQNPTLSTSNRVRGYTHLADVQGHDDLFQRGVARPLSDAVDRALHLAGQQRTHVAANNHGARGATARERSARRLNVVLFRQRESAKVSRGSSSRGGTSKHSGACSWPIYMRKGTSRDHSSIRDVTMPQRHPVTISHRGGRTVKSKATQHRKAAERPTQRT